MSVNNNDTACHQELHLDNDVMEETPEELSLAGLPLAFASTKRVIPASDARIVQKKGKARQKKKTAKQRQQSSRPTSVIETSSLENCGEEFKVVDVLTRHRQPFTILMSTEERIKPCDTENRIEGPSMTSEDPLAMSGSPVANSTSSVMSVGCVSPSESVTICNDAPTDKTPSPLHRYYQQRYDYFHLFDEGIAMDEEGWYSVTPEAIAEHIASESLAILTAQMRTATDNDAEQSLRQTSAEQFTVLDAFCGVGGNTIQFARYFGHVIAVELDAQRLEMARHNATIYGVADRITFIHGDVFQVLPMLAARQQKRPLVDLVFMSPPWGGPSYAARPIYCPRRDLMDGRGGELFSLARTLSKNTILYLPRQTDIFQLASLLVAERATGEKESENESFVVEQHWVRSRLKAISVYFYP